MEAKLQSVFSRALAVPDQYITEDLAYQSIPEWDSLGHLTLIDELESTFNISIETNDVLSLTSYTEVKKLLARHNIDLRN